MSASLEDVIVGSNSSGPTLSFRRRFIFGAISLTIATVIWLPLLHFFFIPGSEEFRSQQGISPVARQLARRHLSLWDISYDRQQELDSMRTNNPEWDFMGRTFLVLSLANMCLHDPGQQDNYLKIMDCIIEDTEQFVKQQGVHYFLMAYSRSSDFVQQPVRSIFIDGELSVMMGARRFIREKEQYRRRMRELVDITAERMAAGPVLSCESYPDECWTFCNAVALTAIRMHDVLDGRDHSDLLDRWVAVARRKLTHAETGLLCSSYTYNGNVLDGPEGSSIWMAAHCLQIVDEEFAADQYKRARKELGRGCLGFAWASEWPESWNGPMDIDSGPTIPILEVNAGSSGLAFLGAASFDDLDYYNSLATTLMFAAFPMVENGGLRFCASNQVGDAVLLYSSVVGPLWEEVNRRIKTQGRL